MHGTSMSICRRSTHVLSFGGRGLLYTEPWSGGHSRIRRKMGPSGGGADFKGRWSGRRTLRHRPGRPNRGRPRYGTCRMPCVGRDVLACFQYHCKRTCEQGTRLETPSLSHHALALAAPWAPNFVGLSNDLRYGPLGDLHPRGHLVEKLLVFHGAGKGPTWVWPIQACLKCGAILF